MFINNTNPSSPNLLMSMFTCADVKISKQRMRLERDIHSTHVVFVSFGNDRVLKVTGNERNVDYKCTVLVFNKLLDPDSHTARPGKVLMYKNV